MRNRYEIITISFFLFLFWLKYGYPHDIWLFPEKSGLPRGDTLVIHQYAGSDLEIEMEVELLRRMTPRFDLITPAETINLLDDLPDFREHPVIKPVLKRKLDFEGLALLNMEHDFIYNEWTKEEFLHYLEHEEFIASQSEHLEGAQTEKYARFMKCLIKAGDSKEGDLYKRQLGQKSEIVLLENPFTLGTGDDLPVQVFYDGQPDSAQLVTAFNGGGGNLMSEIKVLTDADGIARIPLKRKGFWLIRLVHLAPSPDPDADWESYWTCYSFEIN